MLKNMLTTDFTDQLKVEGVNSKGFGIIPKFVMLDRDLTIDAKAIYAYFCSFAGTGNTAFPCREKILADLQISKNAFYKHFNLLQNQGYLTVQQQKLSSGHFARNVYTLVSNPKKLSEDLTASENTAAQSMLKSRGMKALGFGTIPKTAMIDPRLSIKAKGIYAYFCSFSGAGSVAFPMLKDILFHLQINKDTYYRHLSSLLETNYMTIVQRRIDGQLSVNDYYLNDTPDMQHGKSPKLKKTSIPKKGDTVQDTYSMPMAKKRDTAEISLFPQFPKNKDTVNKLPVPQKGHPVKRDNNNNSINNKGIDSIYLFEQKGFERSKETPTEKISFRPTKDRRAVTALLHSILRMKKENVSDPITEILFDAIADMVTASKANSYAGSTVTAQDVCDKLNIALSDEKENFQTFFDTALSDLQQAMAERTIKNLRAYARSVVWSALLTYRVRLCRPTSRLPFCTANAPARPKRPVSYDLPLFEQMASSGALIRI